MCEDCHQEYCCVHGRRVLRFWGLGGTSYPRCQATTPGSPGRLPGHGPGAGGADLPRREWLEEQKAALAQRLRWLDAQLQHIEG